MALSSWPLDRSTSSRFFAAVATGQLTGVTKALGARLVSPILGFLFGWVIHRMMGFALRSARPTANRNLRGFQWLTTAALAFSYGTNDAEKGMGIIPMLQVHGGVSAEINVPWWVILASATAITLGTLAGAWRIVRTLGFGIYKVRSLHALDAQLTSASVILAASAIGGPVCVRRAVHQFRSLSGRECDLGVAARARTRSAIWDWVRYEVKAGVERSSAGELRPRSIALSSCSYGLFNVIGGAILPSLSR